MMTIGNLDILANTIPDNYGAFCLGYRVGLLPIESTLYGYSNPWKRSTRLGKAFEQGKLQGEFDRNEKGLKWAENKTRELDKGGIL